MRLSECKAYLKTRIFCSGESVFYKSKGMTTYKSFKTRYAASRWIKLRVREELQRVKDLEITAYLYSKHN